MFWVVSSSSIFIPVFASTNSFQMTITDDWWLLTGKHLNWRFFFLLLYSRKEEKKKYELPSHAVTWLDYWFDETFLCVLEYFIRLQNIFVSVWVLSHGFCCFVLSSLLHPRIRFLFQPHSVFSYTITLTHSHTRAHISMLDRFQMSF